MLTLHRESSKGQAITEYPLIMGLIAVVCIGLLITLGGNLSNMMNLIASGGGLGLGSVAQATLGAKVGGNAPAAQNGGAPQAPPSTNPWQSGGNDQVIPSAPPATATGTTIEINGKVYELPDPTDPNAIITASSNGSDMSLAYIQQLMLLAKEIEALTPDDPSLATKIRDLANKGYDTAEFQSLVEGCPANQVCQNNPQVTGIDGKTYEGWSAVTDLQEELYSLESEVMQAISAVGFMSAEDKKKISDLITYNTTAINTINAPFVNVQVSPIFNSDGTTSEGVVWTGFDAEGTASQLTKIHSAATCNTQSEHSCG